MTLQAVAHLHRTQSHLSFHSHYPLHARIPFALGGRVHALPPSPHQLASAVPRYSRFMGRILGVISSSLMAIESFSDISLPFFIGLLKVAAIFVCIFCYATGINQIFDIEIDKINKPHLPLASGVMDMTKAVAVILAYAIMTFVLGRQMNFSRPLILGTIVVSIFCIVVALFKDVPDIEGDKKFGIRSLASNLGPKKVFWICVCLLEMAYIFTIVFGATSSRPWSKLITILSHSGLALMLWKQSESIDLKDKFSLQSFYMLIWKLFYAEFMLLPLVR
ncbi:probable homogentisate phytyltransferase 1, chloroplastic [Dendrobium catenatum]|uniref:probable homogentisate phytyltransferase 1, chloroplastic n=1 Tax=Dendrobium catenatum TaxID=906689 RepID=UPI00109F6229|nr:probable homogentisate phytyltransferase 1, chloroplastic [Dendrobium catenatum]